MGTETGEPTSMATVGVVVVVLAVAGGAIAYTQGPMLAALAVGIPAGIALFIAVASTKMFPEE